MDERCQHVTCEDVNQLLAERDRLKHLKELFEARGERCLEHAKEIARLRAINADLLKALEGLLSERPGTHEVPCIKRARAAIARAKAG